MLAKAILVHGVIGYKFCWLLPEDQNQGTPAGHESNDTTVRDHWEDMNQLRHQLGMNHTLLRSNQCVLICLPNRLSDSALNSMNLSNASDFLSIYPKLEYLSIKWSNTHIFHI